MDDTAQLELHIRTNAGEWTDEEIVDGPLDYILDKLNALPGVRWYCRLYQLLGEQCTHPGCGWVRMVPIP